jgi:hypothetical protein
VHGKPAQHAVELADERFGRCTEQAVRAFPDLAQEGADLLRGELDEQLALELPQVEPRKSKP